MQLPMSKTLANTHTTPEVLTTAQVATVMRVHPETVRRLIKAGKLKAVRWNANGGTYRIARAELDRFLYGEVNS